MTPIYFPFTYIHETIAAPLKRFLGPLTVLQPVSINQPEALSRIEEDGHINIRVPYIEDDDRLISCAREFKEWGLHHHGEEISLKDVFKNGFYNKNFTAQIRTDILKNRNGEAVDPDPVFSSRLFLLMAQDLDIQQSDIDSQLAVSMDEELELFNRMTGEERIIDAPAKSGTKNDYGAYMTASRISAWSLLVKNIAEESAFFVTTSRAVVDDMSENLANLETVCRIDGISIEQPEAVIGEFGQCLMRLASTPWSCADRISIPDFITGSGNKMDFQIYILPGTGPADVCRFLSREKQSSAHNDSKWLNTVIGFFEI